MLIVIAQKDELKLVERLGYKNHPVLITGVGGVNVVSTLKDIPKETEILNIGYVGSNTLKPGTIVGISKALTYHEKVEFYEKEFYLGVRKTSEIDGTCNCYTATDFVTKTSKKSPCVFDMELAFICAMFDNVRSIKVVSDNLSIEEYEKNKGE